MTKDTGKQSLEFRKKNFDTVWGEHDQDGDHNVGVRTLVFYPDVRVRNNSSHSLRTAQRTAQNKLDEAVSLCAALELDIIHAEIINLSKIRSSTYLGKGKLEEMAALVEGADIELVVADCELSPGQQRNLERELKVKVIDRTGLILEIFGERAQTKEGVMQVELAHLSYQKSRLVRSWTHLERQRGGFGFLGGPGESQIESDRRQIDERIAKIKKQLSTVSRTRDLHRNSRRRVPFPIVALVGYTNAGKSTLFNYLTHGHVMVADLLFATLDPTMRTVEMPNGKKAIFSDTVGFISELPTHLIAAFRATLEEVIEADIILHIRDISHPETEAQKEDVLEVLKSLGIKEEDNEKIFEVWNKIDLIDEDGREILVNMAQRKDNVAMVSAISGAGCDDLLAKLDVVFAKDKKEFELTFSHAEGADLALFYKYGEILSRQDSEKNTKITVLLSNEAIGRLTNMGKLKEFI